MNILDPAELWERYLSETDDPSPQGAMAFAVDAISAPQTPPSTPQEVREKAADAIRKFCQSLGSHAVVISSDGVERIYHAGLSLDALSVAVALTLSDGKPDERRWRMSDIVLRLQSDAKHHQQVAGDCDCRPEDTVNWEHAVNCLEAADEIQRLRTAMTNEEAELIRLGKNWVRASEGAQ